MASGFIAPPRAWRWRLLQAFLLWNMRRQISDPGLRQALTPDYPAGCKRIRLSDDDYAALRRDNVAAVTALIERFEAEGICDINGRLHPLGAGVFATGFKSLEFLAPLRICGRDGVELQRRWRRECAESLKRTVWSAGCRNRYKTADGHVINNWPYSTLTYWLRMRRIRVTDCKDVARAGSADSPR
ncbi:MAG: hypothetical protein KGJ55_05110 [Gammaproteobacteria bacterium]|nr:hypothetical protein [Gammaproteobacteria bacterium]